jgi:hypothetical protein
LVDAEYRTVEQHMSQCSEETGTIAQHHNIIMPYTHTYYTPICKPAHSSIMQESSVGAKRACMQLE